MIAGWFGTNPILVEGDDAEMKKKIARKKTTSKKSRADRKTARERLSTGGDGRPTTTLREWFGKHEDARILVEEYLKMKAAGETSWTHDEIVEELRSVHGLPFSETSHVIKWCRLNLKWRKK